MAKQLRIEGTYEKPPKDVQEAADKYLDAKRKIAKLRGAMNEWCATLVERMKDKGLEAIEIDDGDAILSLVEQDKLKIESKKKDESDGEE